MNVTVFEAINITKKYRNTLALNQVSMSVMQGDIYGFIGENGAGKTTMIRLLTGLAEPTTGKIALFGESNKKLTKQRERIGCIIESPSLYLDMTAYENLEVQRLQRGIPGKGCIDNALALVGLKDTGKKKAKDFSLGMRQRLALAIALLGNPEFLVLDEPINGLDPASEVINLLGWALACGTVLLALESISIFLCVVIQNTGIVTGICCLYVFSGASVYLMLWSDMETVSIPLKIFVYGNPMYYWMNFSSCRTMGIIEHLPFYFIGCISLLIVGGLIMIRKEIK